MHIFIYTAIIKIGLFEMFNVLKLYFSYTAMHVFNRKNHFVNVAFVIRGTGRTGMGSVTHCYNERMRRNAMRDSFAKLHLLLNIDDPKAARVRIILEVRTFF